MTLLPFTAEASLYPSTNRYRGTGVPGALGVRGHLQLQQLGAFCTPCWKPFPSGHGVQVCVSWRPPSATVSLC